MKPTQPTAFLDMPFCQEGDKTLPKATPDETTEGRFTQSEGFPEITQIPYSKGGIAPNRWDFNGAYYLLSTFAHWAQSGGVMSWKSTLTYVPPAIVEHKGAYWACVTESGPESEGAAAVEPGTDETYWLTLISYLATNTGGEGSMGFMGKGSTVTLTGDTTGSGKVGEDGNVSVETTTAVATKLRTARTITLTGDVTSSAVSFDGSANVSVATTLNASGAMTPNWSGLASRSKNTTYTASTNGYVVLRYGDSKWNTLSIAGNDYQIRNGSGEITFTCIPMKKGDSYSITDGGGTNEIWWLPCA